MPVRKQITQRDNGTNDASYKHSASCQAPNQCKRCQVYTQETHLPCCCSQLQLAHHCQQLIYRVYLAVWPAIYAIPTAVLLQHSYTNVQLLGSLAYRQVKDTAKPLVGDFPSLLMQRAPE